MSNAINTEEIIKIFQIENEKKIEIIKNDKILQKEILDRLREMPKKEFFMTVINTNSKINKKHSFTMIYESDDLISFLDGYSLLNGFFKFLPTYINNRIPELNKNVDLCSEYIKDIVEQWSPLIRKIISQNFLSKHSYMATNYMELFAGGINGVVISIYKFDTNRGVKFMTHAYRWIIYYIYREMDDVVKTYNDRLYDDDNFFDTLEVNEDCETNMLNSAEIDKFKKMDFIDKYEEKMLDLVLIEKITLEEASKVIKKIQGFLQNDIKMLADYIRA